MLTDFLSLFTRRVINIPPPAVLALLYGVLIITGSALLKIPLAATMPISWSDAVFTAASAITVTGLGVLDTGSAFTPFGQAVILVLIQLGGLGLMTFAVLVLQMFGYPVGMPHRIFLREELNQTSMYDLLKLVGVILRVVLLCELVGAALLATVFVPEFGWEHGLWHALFHAISAFNNAGFALFPDNLSRWATSPVVNIVVPGLLIIGGIGFIVLSDIARARRWRKFSLHTKLMLTGTAALLVWSVAGITVLEWSNPGTLGQFDSIADKLMVGWFQAVTTRTAGFNTIDIASLHDSTSLMMISLMLIGGGSTSTAGGIKVTTFIVLLLATVAFFKRRDTLHAFGRSLGHEEIMKVLALTVLSLLLTFTGIFVMSIAHDGDFLALSFEVVSALATVGLSHGVTTDLDGTGRIVIVILMFLGRVGPLTLGFFLATHIPPRFRYPSSKVFLG
jgi:trk system potassium uptake protein